MCRTLGELFTGVVSRIRKHKKYKPEAAVVKVNLGCGLSVAGGWINVDGSLNALFAKCPKSVLKILYNLSGSKQWYSQDEYVDTLKSNSFIHHNLEYGIPFSNECVDYLYSSHLLEHLFIADAERLIREAFRVLKEGGRIRICVPDLGYAISLYHQGEKESALKYFFPASRTEYFGRHRYMYDFELLEALLSKTGFISAERCMYRKGKVADIEKLDDRAEETLFVEASKRTGNLR